MTNKQNLPIEWDVYELDTVIDILDRHREPVSKDEREKRTEGLGEEQLYPYYGAGGQIGWIDDYIFNEELVLVAEDGATTGYTYKITGKSWVSNHAHVLKSGAEKLSNEFLYYYLKSYDFDHLKTGSTRPKLTQTNLKKVRVPVPPVSEQTRVVAHLEEQLERVERLERSVKTVEKLSDEYENSIMAYTFAGKEYHSAADIQTIPSEEDIPDHWYKSTIDDVATVILGNSPPGSSYNENDDGVPFIQGASSMEEMYPNTERYTTEPSKMCKKGDTILAIRATIGDLNVADKEYCLGRGVAGVRAGSDVTQEYLHHYLKIIDRMDYWREVSTGATFNSITKTNIQELEIPVPPIEEQRNIVNKFGEIDFTRIKKSSELLQSLFDEYRDSVLAYAFQNNSSESYDSTDISETTL